MVELVVAFISAFARIGAVLAFAPIPSLRHAPAGTRVLLALLLSVVLVPGRLEQAPAAELGISSLLRLVLLESSRGLAYGVATAIALEGFQLGCQLIGLQAGLSYASTLDPTSQADSTALSVFVLLTTGTLFLGLDMHHQLIRALSANFPQTAGGQSAAALMLRLAGHLFVVGLRLAAPISALMLAIDVGLALFSRIQPQLQVITLAFSLKILMALLAIAAILPALLRLLQNEAALWQKTLAAF